MIKLRRMGSPRHSPVGAVSRLPLERDVMWEVGAVQQLSLQLNVALTQPAVVTGAFSSGLGLCASHGLGICALVARVVNSQRIQTSPVGHTQIRLLPVVHGWMYSFCFPILSSRPLFKLLVHLQICWDRTRDNTKITDCLRYINRDLNTVGTRNPVVCEVALPTGRVGGVGFGSREKLAGAVWGAANNYDKYPKYVGRQSQRTNRPPFLPVCNNLTPLLGPTLHQLWSRLVFLGGGGVVPIKCRKCVML